MEGTPDRGSLGSVTGIQVSSILVGRVISFGFTRRGELVSDRGVRGSIVSEQRLGGQCPVLFRTIR